MCVCQDSVCAGRLLRVTTDRRVRVVKEGGAGWRLGSDAAVALTLVSVRQDTLGNTLHQNRTGLQEGETHRSQPAEDPSCHAPHSNI
jgi:hypothetical protein